MGIMKFLRGPPKVIIRSRKDDFDCTFKLVVGIVKFLRGAPPQTIARKDEFNIFRGI